MPTNQLLTMLRKHLPNQHAKVNYVWVLHVTTNVPNQHEKVNYARVTLKLHVAQSATLLETLIAGRDSAVVRRAGRHLPLSDCWSYGNVRIERQRFKSA